MTRKEQIDFVQTLSKNTSREIIGKIQKGIVPERWEGLELRRYLIETLGVTGWGRADRKRRAEYNNDIAVTANL